MICEAVMLGKIFAVVGAALLIACSSCAHHPVPDAPAMLAQPSVGKLLVLDETGDLASSCTVWKVDERRAVTAGHCCEDDHFYGIEGQAAVPGDQISVLVDNDDVDICVLAARMRGEPIQIAYTDPPIGSRVWSLGYPKGYFMIADGYWSGRIKGNQPGFSIDGTGGFSGAPVLDSKNRAVSVLIEGYLGHSVTFGVPLEQIRIALSAARAKGLPED